MINKEMQDEEWGRVVVFLQNVTVNSTCEPHDQTTHDVQNVGYIFFATSFSVGKNSPGSSGKTRASSLLGIHLKSSH